MNRKFVMACGLAGWLLAGTALAAGMQDCKQFEGKGAGPKSESNFPPYQVELQFFACAGMTRDVAKLDALDHDMLIGRARWYSLEVLREKQTETNPPIKYSRLTTAARLAKLKQLVEAYYKP